MTTPSENEGSNFCSSIRFVDAMGASVGGDVGGVACS